MSSFGFSSQNVSSAQLLSYEPFFAIFLNQSLPFRPLNNDSTPIQPMNSPDTLLKLFQSLKSRSPNSPNLPFSPFVRHTSDEKPRKGSFLTSTIAHVVYLITSCVVVCMVAPQIYLAFKHKKIRTLVTAMALQRLPVSEAMSAFKIPNTKEAKLVCQDPWVSIAVTTMIIIGIVVYLYKTCNRMTFFMGYLYDNVCTVYLFISHDCYHVPLKLRELNGFLHNFTLNGQIKSKNMQLLKHALWDTINMRWLGATLNMNDRRIDLPENRTIPLWDKVKVRALTAHKNVKYNIMVKQGNTWHAPRNEARNLIY